MRTPLILVFPNCVFITPVSTGATSTWLIVACSGNEKKPDISKIKCFIASQSQGINFFPGTWHHPLIIIDKVQDFLILDRDDGNDKVNKNLTVYNIKSEIVLNY